MRNFHLILCAILLSGWLNFSYSQLDHSTVFLSYKRSTTANFLNGEFQIGNKDEMHYFTVQAGVNLSGYTSLKYCPYYTGTVALNPNFGFSEYTSKKKGIQAGLGYCHYFKNLENEKQYIPFVGMDVTWFRNYDQYTLEYTEPISGQNASIEKEYHFSTLSGGIQVGLIYTTELFYYKASLGIEYYLPVNDHTYMPTDSYNVHSSTKLPLAGIEPFLQIGIGFKLF